MDEVLSFKLYDIMVQPQKEDFLTKSFEDLKSLNQYFQINSKWGRGSKEMLMLSIITSQQISYKLEETFNNLSKKFSEKMQSSDDIFTGLYVKELNRFEDTDKELIRKNDSLIKSWVQELYWEILEIVRDLSEEKK